MIIIPLDAIRYMNCFVRKNFDCFLQCCYLSLLILLIVCLSDVAINFGRYRYHLLSFFGRVTVLCLIVVSKFPCPSRILFLLIVISRVVSLHLSFNASLPVFLIVIFDWRPFAHVAIDHQPLTALE